MLERSSLPRLSGNRLSRPLARIRIAAGRHRTLWRVMSALAAAGLALALSSTSPSQSSDAATIDADLESLASEPTTDSPVQGSVGVALPRTTAFPEVEVGSLVHAVAVNDPLVSGETRAAVIVVRDARVLEVNERAVTIEAAEADAVTVVEAMTTGSVVVVAAGGR